MTNERLAAYLRIERANIEYILRIKYEDIAILNERKAQIERQLQKYETER
ncbi:hypothetical protein [Paenibacillus dakarensis]|nr:hypothetical protein [Paenibacillus dakarensis]